MAAHNQFGAACETLAARWLQARGFEIITRNWRSGRYEIDIVATKEDTLHIVEVKARSDDRFGLPEEWVDRRKGRFITKAGASFQSACRGANGCNWRSVQYDIVAILALPGLPPDIFFIEDVYWWG